jgi:glutathione synthase
MTLKIAIQMDDIATINVAGDTTYILALEAQKRGYELYYYTPDKLSLSEDGVMAEVHSLEFFDGKEEFYKLGTAQQLDLSKTDVVLMRQDPPFNMRYITSTYILQYLEGKSLVVNNPQSVRDCSEKMFTMNFPQFTAKTLISENHAEIAAFHQRHGDIIIKPLYSFGGDGVFRVKKDDGNFASIIDLLQREYQAPLVVQQYIKNAAKGDKRVIMIDGEIAGSMIRIPQNNDVRSNLCAGGKAAKTKLTTGEEEICRVVGPELKKRGLFFVGLDLIDGHLTEINVTSPTGVRQINKLENLNLEKIFWDKLEPLIPTFINIYGY